MFLTSALVLKSFQNFINYDIKQGWNVVVMLHWSIKLSMCALGTQKPVVYGRQIPFLCVKWECSVYHALLCGGNPAPRKPISQPCGRREREPERQAVVWPLPLNISGPLSRNFKLSCSFVKTAIQALWYSGKESPAGSSAKHTESDIHTLPNTCFD